MRHRRARERGPRPSQRRLGAGAWSGYFASGHGRDFTGGRREFALFGAIYLLYDAARWVWAGNLPLARAHALRVIAVERSLHMAIEGSVQRALDSPVPSFLLSSVYLAAQAVVLPATLVWLYRRSPRIYQQLRSTVVATWLIATPVFALYPVAPPRLAGVGIKDIVSHQAVVSLTGPSTLFYNPYAAVPSLHVGLAFAVGVGAAAALHRRWARGLALLWGPLVTVAVVATGNHYLFDAATGLLVAATAFVATRTFSRGHIAVRLPRRAAGLRASRGSAPAAEPPSLPAAAAAGPAAGITAEPLLSAPAAARPNRTALAVRHLVPEGAAAGPIG